MADNSIDGSQVDEALATAEEEEEDPKEALKKVIRVKVADAGVLRRTVNITVPRDNLKDEFNKEFDELIAEAVVPGFRRGRAPRRLVEKRFGRDVNEQVQTRIVSNAYIAAIEKEDLKVLGDPMIWVAVKDGKSDESGQERLLDMGAALKHMKLPDEGDFDFRCEVEVKPEFELPKLEGVEIERPDLKISDEDVQVQIDRTLAQRGTWAPVEEKGKVEVDDLLVCNMKMTCDGSEVKTEENLVIQARPQRIEGAVVSDLGDQVKGAKVGDTCKVSAELPDDYEVEDLRGKKADMALTVLEIKRLKLPPLDKAFLSASGFDSEDEYRSWVRSRMEAQLEHEIKQGMRSQVRKYLLDNTELDLPEGLSSRQTERAASRKMVELRRRGMPEAEIEKHADELRTSARDEALAELKLHFVLEEIAEKLEINVTEEEINGQIAAMAQAYNRRFDRVRDELARSDAIPMLYLELRDEKCIDQVLNDAKISEAKGPKPSAEKKKKKTTAKKAESEPKASAAKKKTTKKAAKKTTKKATKKTSE